MEYIIEFNKKNNTIKLTTEHEEFIPRLTELLEDYKEVCGDGRHRDYNHTSYPAPYICCSFGSERSRPEECARNDGTFGYFHDTGVRGNE